VTLPPLANGSVPGAVTTVPVAFPALTGTHFVLTFTAIRPEYAPNFYSAGRLALPLGVAEVGIPGVRAAPTPGQLPGNCLANLLSIDGRPLDVAVVGSSANALDGSQLQVVPCGLDANGITLSAGPHVVQTVAGHNPNCSSNAFACTGWNLDQLALDSAAGGGPGPAVTPTAAGSPQLQSTSPGAAPAVTTTASHIDSESASISKASQPFEFVLGQSINQGWHAEAQPAPGAPAGSHAVDLGPPQLIDGFANGWHVTAADLHALGGSHFSVVLTWTPQRAIWAALAISAVTFLLCLLLGFLPARSRRWLRARLPRRLRGPAGPAGPTRPAEPFDPPVLTAPFTRDQAVPVVTARPSHVARALVVGVATGAVASLVVPVFAALAVGAVTALGLLLPWARVVATVGGLAFVVAGCVNVIRGQSVHHYGPGADWAGNFVHAGNLIWIGLALLLADAVITAFGLRSQKPLRRRATKAEATADPTASAQPAEPNAPA
jgi:hypothetical protein